MSLYLVCVEFGRDREMPVDFPPLKLTPVKVRPRGPSSPPRAGYAVTDGLASDRLRAGGRGVVGRQGELLREAFSRLVQTRLARGQSIGLCFVWVTGMASEFTIDIAQAHRVSLSQLPTLLQTLPIEVAALIDPETSSTESDC